MSSDYGFSLVNKNRRAVLLLHGLTGSPFEMRYFGGKLHKMGYDIFCPCLPGHCTNIENLKSKSWQNWVDFVRKEFYTLLSTYDEVFISGLCLGALIALAIAINDDAPRAIALLSPTLALDGWSLPWYRFFRFLLPLAQTPLRHVIDYSFKEAEPYGVKNEHVRKKIIYLLRTNNIVAYDRYPAVTIIELKRISKYIRRNIGKVKVPTIIMHAELDDITKIGNAEFIYENVGSAEKDLVRLKDSYHLITVDNEKDIVIQKTVEFFDCVSSLNGELLIVNEA
jgi:carboxylesterase